MSRPPATLVFSMIQSLDGYVSDESGRFDWAAPDESVHSFLNELERSAGTYLYGRRMYEVMVAWETMGLTDDAPAYIREYADMWRAADKIVYSTTLDDVSSERTRIVRTFDPDEVRALKEAGKGDVSISGPTLASHAFAADLVDEVKLVLAPVVVGGGTSSLPAGVTLPLELVDERRFDNGMVYVHYRKRD